MCWRGDRVPFIAIVVVLLGVTACQGPCVRRRPPKGSGSPLGAESAEARFAAHPISYCRGTRVSRPSGTVQLLVDASGSMVGVKASIPTFATWIEHAVSSLKGVAMDVTQERTCQFNQGRGIFGCAPHISLGDYMPQSSTNLHDAVRAAASSDLTFIITDGVAATSPGGTGDCASGVDAACVARALSDVMHLSDAPATPGIWMLPLVAQYNGVFYSEEAVAPNDFDRDKTAQNIRLEFGIDDMDVFVTDPKQGSDGRLTFTYRGPKALVLIVIANSATLGRDAVAALWGAMERRSIARLDQLKQFRAGLAGLQPLEVYPGHLPRITFERLDRTDVPAEHSGTLDAAWTTGETRSTLRLDCPANGAGQGVYLLKGRPVGSTEGHGCVPLLMLPPYVFGLPAVRSTDESDLRRMVRGFRREDSASALRLDLACGGAQRRACDTAAIPVRWEALLDYRRAADGVGSAGDDSPALRVVRASSTEQPSRAPHRIFGFASILAAFYASNASDQQRLSLASFSVCSGAGS